MVRFYPKFYNVSGLKDLESLEKGLQRLESLVSFSDNRTALNVDVWYEEASDIAEIYPKQSVLPDVKLVFVSSDGKSIRVDYPGVKNILFILDGCESDNQKFKKFRLNYYKKPVSRDYT